ncbi:MAG: hypothetical protein AB1668_00855 [Nanoarchaeota archaeon]
MARRDAPLWTFVGIFIGMVATALVNENLILLGALAGGIIGYSLGKAVR